MIYSVAFTAAAVNCSQSGTGLYQSGMQAVAVISTSSSGKFNFASTVVLAGLLVGKNLAYSSL
jgi:hypothetical protein